MRPFCELHQMYHVMPGDCHSMSRHGEAVRRETARQERRQERAQHIARNTPLPATWRASVEMTTVLQAEIVAYGAACARWAMNEQEKEA